MGSPLPGSAPEAGLRTFHPRSSKMDLHCCDIPPTSWSPHGEQGITWVLTESPPFLPISMQLFLYMHSCKKICSASLRDNCSICSCSFGVNGGVNLGSFYSTIVKPKPGDLLLNASLVCPQNTVPCGWWIDFLQL